MALVSVGRVVRAIGLRGELGIAGSEATLQPAEVVLESLEGETGRRSFRVLRARPQGRLWVVALEGVEAREAAEALVGQTVWVERAALGEAGEGRYYWADLEGLPVVTVAGGALGRVKDLVETGGVDVLVVQGAAGEVLIPLAPYVTVEKERVVVDPPEGLLELGAEAERAEEDEPGRGG